MDKGFEELSQSILEKIREMAKTETVIGEQFTLGEYTCVPVVRIGIGFGSGGGSGDSPKQGKGSGGGAGAGIGVEPLGFLATRGSEIQMISVGKSNPLSSFFEKMPDVAEKFADAFKGKGKNKEEAGEE